MMSRSISFGESVAVIKHTGNKKSLVAKIKKVSGSNFWG